MTKFAISVIVASAFIVALGWLAAGGSVDINAASGVERFESFQV
ncbi:hypothetical protein [Ruegeria atlantica]|nr:hypothetical protein [Ruegeria atlantica]